MTTRTVPVLAALLGIVWASRASAPAADRVADWREDLRTLAAELPRLHKNAFHETTKEAWAARVAALDRDIPELKDHEVIVRLMTLVASIGDAHTFVDVQGRFRRYPLALRAFRDGVFVVTAAEEHAWALGWRIETIDGTDVDAARAAVAPTVSHENEVQIRDGSIRSLTTPEILNATGVSLGVDEARFTVQRGTETRELAARAYPTNALPPFRSLPAPDAPGLPLYRTDTGKNYWWKLVDDGAVMYIAYNKCAVDPARSFADFTKEVNATIDSRKPGRVVIDLRNNGGGNSMVIAPLIEVLRRDARINQPGRLFVLIGPRTHSSAMMNAIQFRNATKAVLVGEPTGGRPNSYGEIKFLTLPKSGLRVGYATKYFQQIRDADPPSVKPDVIADLSSEDWFSGKDPVMDAVRAYAPGR